MAFDLAGRLLGRTPRTGGTMAMGTGFAYRDEYRFGRSAAAQAFRCGWPLLCALLLLFNSGPVAVAQSSPGFLTLSEADAFVTMYYQRPQPERVEHVMDSVPLARRFAQQPNSRAGYVGFLSEVFTENPDRLPAWTAVAAKQDQAMQAVFGEAIAVMNAGGVMARKTHSAEDNDRVWGAFFASGRAALVQSLIEELRFIDSTDIQLYWAGATAKWSLASNAQTHPRVRTILEAATSTSEMRTREILMDLLQKDPARIRQEIKDMAAERSGVAQRR